MERAWSILKLYRAGRRPGPALFPNGAGFTLVEMLVVVGIILVLAAMVIRTSRYATVRGQVSKARAELQLIAHAMEEYRAHYGRYPAATGLHGSAQAAGNTRLSPGWMYAVWTRPQQDGRLPFLRVPWLEGMNLEAYTNRSHRLHTLSLEMADTSAVATRMRLAEDYLKEPLAIQNVTAQQVTMGVEKPVYTHPFNMYLTVEAEPHESPAFVDPWGRDYMYFRHPDPDWRHASRGHPFNNPGSRFAYDLWSYGPGRRASQAQREYIVSVTDDADWISNWKSHD